MRDHNPAQEQAFFDLLKDYYDLEQNPIRSYAPGEYTLERMRPLADLAGHPEQRLRVVHVAGTKGKGSTCHMISALLAAAGLRCGLFTSPHLATVRERFQIDNRLIDYGTLDRHTRAFEAKLRARGLSPTMFEIMTVLAMEIFVAEGCEFAVMETGIGGLLDATNYVPRPECCGITSISFDHTQLLGNSIEEIAAQKAGIVKPGVPVVCAAQPYPAAEAVIRAQAAKVGAPLYGPAEPEALAGWARPDWPAFLKDNFRTALQVCRVLGVRPDRAAFAMPQLRARCERNREQPHVLLDGAHNADSAEKLVASVRQIYPGQEFTVVLGIVTGKDVAGIFNALCRLTRRFVLTNPKTPKGSELDVLDQLAQAAGVTYRVVPDIRRIEDLAVEGNLLFTGSFFTAVIGEMLYSTPSR